MAQAGRSQTPNSMVILSGNNEDSAFKPKRPSSGKKHKLKRESSSTSLEILPPEDKENDRKHGTTKGGKKSSRPTSARPDSSGGSRPGSSATRAPPVRDSPSHRPPTPGTPSRQVSLQTVRRKEEKELDLGPLDWEPSVTLSEQQLPGQVDRLTIEDTSTKKEHVLKEDAKGDNGIKDINDSDEFDTDLEDSDDDGEEEEEEKPTAPTELMLEFLETVYKKEWNIARNLCKMILLYEPDNAEATKFAPLIEEKLQIDAEPSSDEETDDSDDSDSDDDSDESDDELLRRKRRKRKKKCSIKKSSQDSTDDEYNAGDEEEVTEESKKDSGIGLTSPSGSNLT